MGRLNHVGFIIPQARHFLGRLYLAQTLAARKGGRGLALNEASKSDLRLWLQLLQQAQQGISLNLVTFRVPTLLLRSEACEHGIGGYNLRTGRAWRWQIPAHLRLRASLNSLQFVASYWAIAIDHAYTSIPLLQCILSQTDSTSTAGWLHKSNFHDAHLLQLRIARATATLLLEAQCVLYSRGSPAT